MGNIIGISINDKLRASPNVVDRTLYDFRYHADDKEMTKPDGKFV